LLDECVDWRLSRDIVGHEVRTARQMGWSTIANGELLAQAAARFDIIRGATGSRYRRSMTRLL
jgi:hypothetical protein